MFNALHSLGRRRESLAADRKSSVQRGERPGRALRSQTNLQLHVSQRARSRVLLHFSQKKVFLAGEYELCKADLVIDSTDPIAMAE
jgi:hypothetical protein